MIGINQARFLSAQHGVPQPYHLVYPEINRIVDIKSKNPLHGTWKCCDGFSDVQFTISTRSGVLAVDGTDTHDGEKAEIQTLCGYPTRALCDSPLTGFEHGEIYEISISAILIEKARVGVTYTYTAQEIWEKV